jgi:hypothetical protein
VGNPINMDLNLEPEDHNMAIFDDNAKIFIHGVDG